MFKLVKQDTFTWPVILMIPGNGQHKRVQFTGRFRFMDRDQMERSIEDDEEFVRLVLAGWEKFADADGEEIAYSEENLEQAIKYPFFTAGVIEAYFDALGGKKARRKN